MEIIGNISKLANLRSCNGINVSLDDLPINLVVIDDNLENFYLNKQALTFFADGDDELAKNVIDINIEIVKTLEMLLTEVKDVGKISEQQIVIKKFSGSKTFIECTLSYLYDKKLFFVYFEPVFSKDYLNSFVLLNSVKDDFLKLKPYMNKYGKDMLVNIWDKVYSNELSEFSENKTTLRNHYIKVIQDRYPRLTDKEQVICSMYAMNMSVNEIATILDKSPNNIRVATHRIVKKLGMYDTKQMVREMKEIKI